MQAVMALLPARNPDRTWGLVGGQRINFSTSSEVKHWGAGEIAQPQPYDLVRRSGHIGGESASFKLVQEEHVDLEVYYHWSRFRDEWILQSSWVFDALDITEGKENFFIVEPPCLGLRSTQCPTTFSTLCNAKHPVEETSLKPIYLFVHPPPTTLSKLVFWLERPHHFWSFDKTGQSQLSEEECEWWGLPVLVPDTRHPIGVELYSWPTHIYTALQDWQKAMGFDPTTSDWAQSRGYLELEIVGTEDRFVLVEKTSDESGISNEDSEWEVLGA
uniref:Uncharacterized protein n=1 Tax=Moniliophthora roreri TaxID=221103 RepID=A0A0W0G267_MONRR